VWESIKEYFIAVVRWWWVVTISTTVGGITFAFNLLGGATVPVWVWIALAIMGLFIAQFLAFHKIQTELGKIKNSCPNITFIDTENVLGDVVSKQAGRIISRENPWFTRIKIANSPESTLQAVSAVIAAHITFYDSSGNKCFPTMIGRWAETPEIAQGAQPIEIEQPTIPPTGRPYILDIGLKYHDEDEFYGYNNETPRRSTVGFRDKGRQLNPDAYSVEVKLKGADVDEAFWFDLINNGKGQEVEFRSKLQH
jgi:hypothetical protein